MAEHKFAFVEPGRDRRKRREHMKALLKESPGPERARQLAELARELHDNRELNLAMDTGRLAIEDADGSVMPLVAAYVRHERADHTIEDLAMLADLGRWLDSGPLTTLVRTMAFERGLDWCGCTDGRERERRIDTVRRRFDDHLADEIDLALI